jgi:hypothetical protein
VVIPASVVETVDAGRTAAHPDADALVTDLAQEAAAALRNHAIERVLSMYLAKVIGTVVSTSKDARLVGFKLLLTRRLTRTPSKTGTSRGVRRHRGRGQR